MTGLTTEGQRLRRLNELPKDAAVGELLAVCHARRWAERVAAGRPYADVDALQKAADEIWMDLAPADWLEAFKAHPRIGEPPPHGSAGWSRHEQAGVGAADEDVQVAIAIGNAEYETRFGHVFLISAEGRDAEQILAELRRRLGNEADTELRMAAEEHRRITRLRIDKLMKE